MKTSVHPGSPFTTRLESTYKSGKVVQTNGATSVPQNADKQSRPPFKKPSPIPKGFNWDALIKLDGDDLETHRHTLMTGPNA